MFGVSLVLPYICAVWLLDRTCVWYKLSNASEKAESIQNTAIPIHTASQPPKSAKSKMLGDGNPYIDNTQNDAFELAQCYTEALKDSRSLQALADDLLDTLIRTQRELAEANLHAPIPSSSNQIDTLCNLGKYVHKHSPSHFQGFRCATLTSQPA